MDKPINNEGRTLEPGLIDGQGLHTEILEKFRTVQEKDRLEIAEAGGPESFVRKALPLVHTLYPGPWTPELIGAETLSGWREAEERLQECANCPAHGGTCENSLNKEGHRIAVRPPNFPDSPIEYVFCDKWQVFDYRAASRRSGIPNDALTDRLEYFDALDQLRATSKPGPAGQAAWDFLDGWVKAARGGGGPKARPAPSFVLTGGSAPERTAVALAVAKMLVRRYSKRSVRYTFGPRLAAELREHFDAPEGERDPVGPVALCEQAPVLVFDFCDPLPKTREPWAPWFREKVELMIWARLGDMRPTMLVSPKSAADLWELFECASVYQVGEIDAGSLGL